MTLYIPENELAPQNRVQLVKEIVDALNKAGVVYGIKSDILPEGFPRVWYLIAEGVPQLAEPMQKSSSMK